MFIKCLSQTMFFKYFSKPCNLVLQILFQGLFKYFTHLVHPCPHLVLGAAVSAGVHQHLVVVENGGARAAAQHPDHAVPAKLMLIGFLNFDINTFGKSLQLSIYPIFSSAWGRGYLPLRMQCTVYTVSTHYLPLQRGGPLPGVEHAGAGLPAAVLHRPPVAGGGGRVGSVHPATHQDLGPSYETVLEFYKFCHYHFVHILTTQVAKLNI